MIPDSNEVRIEVSTLCNYNCLICPHDKMTREKRVMNYAEFASILEKVQGYGYETLTFSGIGEPLLDDGLTNKVWLAKNAGYKTILLTNGQLLTQRRLEHLIDVGLDSVRISFYGMNKHTYAKAHGTTEYAFEVVKLNTLNACMAPVETVLTFNIIPGVNEDDLDEWLVLWSEKAALEVWHPHNWVYGKKYREVQSEKLKTCGRPFNGPLQIQVDGTVIMCCFDYDGKLLLGDLKTQSLEEIFGGDMYKHIKYDHELGDHYTEDSIGNAYPTICESCDQRNADKSDVMVYSSEHDLVERVTLTSTTYRRVGR